MHQLQRIGLWGITILLLLGFWAGLWYQGQRRGDTFVITADSGDTGGTQGEGADDRPASAGASGSPEQRGESASGREGPDTDTAVYDRGGLDWADALDPYAVLNDRDNPRTDQAVHVVGAVASPGLYYMPWGSRIYDAVMEAEPEEDADLAKINLAMPCEDGMQVRVPVIGQPSPWVLDGYVVRAGKTQEEVQSGDIQAAGSGKININTASAKDLETLPGIGPVYSQRIIDYREKNGGFKTVDDLMKVKGIGTAKMSELRDMVTCS